jgi:hypothetical protein
VSAAKLSHNETRTSRRPTDREIVYLVAPGGNPNYGDEFILRAWPRHLARVRPEADVVVDCHTPGQAAVLLRSSHPRVTFVDTIWRICPQTAHLPPAEAVARPEPLDPGAFSTGGRAAPGVSAHRRRQGLTGLAGTNLRTTRLACSTT